MNTKVIAKGTVIGFLILLLTAPPWALAQDSGGGRTFSQQELDQMLAPIALYADSLLAQLLVAATYPDQVADAAQWAQQNRNLTGKINRFDPDRTWQKVDRKFLAHPGQAD